MSWVILAIVLKQAAARVDCYADNGVDVDLTKFLSVYRYLIGVSLENLLKAVIVAQGTPAGHSNKLDPRFLTHNVDELFPLVDTTKLRLSSKEKRILRDLQPFVEWAGADTLFQTLRNGQEWLAFV
jgi:hypothetical protein